MHQRLADIGVDVAGQGRQPGLEGIDGLADAGEPEAVDDALDLMRRIKRALDPDNILNPGKIFRLESGSAS